MAEIQRAAASVEQATAVAPTKGRHRRIHMSGSDQDGNRNVQEESSLPPMLVGGLVLIVVGMLLVAWLV